MGGISFVEFKKKELTKETYEGWGHLMARLGGNFTKYINEVLTYPEK